MIKTFELYNNTKQLKIDISNLAIVKKRYDAGIEFCGLAPCARAQVHARDITIQAIEQGKSCRVASLEAGVSRKWALEKLHDNGYQFNFVLKKWSNGERCITRTFEINGVHRNISEKETAKVDKLVTLILSGYSLNQACIMADIDKGRARTSCLWGDIYQNKKWVRHQM